MALTNYGNAKNGRQRQRGLGMSVRVNRTRQLEPTNFWFTKNGDRKQVHKLLRPYWPLILSVSSSWPHTLDIQLLTSAIQELYSYSYEDAMCIAARLHGYPALHSSEISPAQFNRGDVLLMEFRSRFVKVGPPTSTYTPKLTLAQLLD